MLVSKDKITELLPQRYPTVMVDELLSCDEKQAVSRLLISKDNIFLERSSLSPSGMMEAMAQTAAARTGFLLKNNPGSENKKVPVGVIGSIKNFRLYFQPQTGSVALTTVVIEHEVLQATIIKAKVEVDGKVASESNLQIFLTGDHPSEP
jgi:3-hydroxymyristoyl/3-hydroxydecanoyl-(acyl carrier protein) dehydratase